MILKLCFLTGWAYYMALMHTGKLFPCYESFTFPNNAKTCRIRYILYFKPTSLPLIHILIYHSFLLPPVPPENPFPSSHLPQSRITSLTPTPLETSTKT